MQAKGESAPSSLLSTILKHDLPASFVVFLVAVPLSLGIALASNAPIMAGIISAAIGGIVVGMLAGAPLQVSGPAAGLIVMVFDLVEKLGGDWRMVCAITALAGVTQLVFAVFGVARTALAISPAVVHGMLAGIGILIVLGQVHVVLGGSPGASAFVNIRDLPAQLGNLHVMAAVLGLLTIAILVLWPYIPVIRLRRVPAPLVAVTVATVASLGVTGPLERINLRADDHAHPIVEGHVAIEDPAAVATAVGDQGSILAAVQLPTWPDLPAGVLAAAVLALALVASVESLLCAVATDKLHTGPRANLDRELLAQGAGNTLSGLLGGLPITGVIVRSSANITAGGRTRASGILHGVWVLVFVLALPFVIESIPKSVLAGLLVVVGVKLVNLNHARQLRHHNELSIYLITIGGIVAIDLLSGVAIGFGVAVLRLIWRLARVQVEVEQGDELWKVHVRGALTFLGVPRVVEALAKIPPGVNVDLDLAVSNLDHAGWEAIEGWKEGHERTGAVVHVERVEDMWETGSRRLRQQKEAVAKEPAEVAQRA
ncbi:MAG: SulP family inorganic anion transporter [Planctomycetes bacterium]|nr:SulP family inorganic anion transporter [Planctomycetota bacterium]